MCVRRTMRAADNKSPAPAAAAAAGAGAAAASAAAAGARPHLFGSFLSTPARGVMHYIAECCPDAVDVEDVNFGGGGHQTAEYMRTSAMKKVPALRVGDFTLSESSAILLYLAERYGPAATLPRLVATDAKVADPVAAANARRAYARVVSAIELIQSDVSRSFPGGLVYPQLFPGGRKEDDTLHSELLRLGAVHGTRQFALLDHTLSQHKFLCGDEKTCADFFALSVVYLAVCVECDLTAFVHLNDWIKRMSATPAFAAVYKPLIEWANSPSVKQQRVAKRMVEKCVGWNGVDAHAAVAHLKQLLTATVTLTDAAKYDTPADAKRQPAAGPALTLYCSYFSAPSRAVLHFVHNSVARGLIPADAVRIVSGINLGAGEQHTPAFRQRVSRHGLVPVLVETDPTSGARWTLTESAAILRYLALLFPSAGAAYQYNAQDAEQRARMNERIAWFNSTFMTLYGYHMSFAQTTQAAEWGAGKGTVNTKDAAAAKVWALRELDALENVWLARSTISAPYLLGSTLSLGDMFGHALLSAGWFVGADWSDYANITRWSRAVLDDSSSAGAKQTYTPFREWLATKPFGPTDALVSIRPNMHALCVVRTRLPLTDDAAFRGLVRELATVFRGTSAAAARDVTIDIVQQSTYAGPGGVPRKVALISTVFPNKAAYVSYVLSAEYVATQAALQAWTGVDASAATVELAERLTL